MPCDSVEDVGGLGIASAIAAAERTVAVVLSPPLTRGSVVESVEMRTEESASQKLLETKPKSYSSAVAPEESTALPEEEEKESGSNVKEEKPDGGWGWAVVFGVALSNMTTQSLISVFGLLFIERLQQLEITTRGASLMMGVQTTTLNLSGLITGPIIYTFSYRKTAVAGAILVIAGLLLTTHADTLPEFVFTYSLFTGLGLGLLYPSTFVAIDSYFTKRRGRAVGLSVAGTGIGQMLYPLLVEYLLDVYGFRGTLLILAGLASHSLLGATLYQPAKWHTKRCQVTVEDGPKGAEETGRAGANQRTEAGRKPRRRKRATNVELMRSWSFVNLLVGLAMVYAANMCFSMLLPFFLESIDYTLDDVALCMSALSGADIVGRLIVPIFTDDLHIKSKTIFFLGALLSAVARSGLMFTRDFVPTVLLAAACGVVRAALICNFNLSISEQTTPEKLPSALGLHMIFKGIAMMAFAPLIGFVRDYTKSYAFCMHILSVFFLFLPFLAWLLEYVLTKRKL